MVPSFEDALRGLARREGYDVAAGAQAGCEVLEGWQADSGTSWPTEIVVTVEATPHWFRADYATIPELWADLFKET